MARRNIALNWSNFHHYATCFPSFNGVCSLVSFSGFIEHQWRQCELLQYQHASYVICCDVRSLCCFLDAISTLASKGYMNYNNAMTGYALLTVLEHKFVAIMLCMPKNVMCTVWLTLVLPCLSRVINKDKQKPTRECTHWCDELDVQYTSCKKRCTYSVPLSKANQ